MFHATEAESTLKLLLRCELLLSNYTKETKTPPTPSSNNNAKQSMVNGIVKSNEVNEVINGGGVINGVNGHSMQTTNTIIEADCPPCINMIKNDTKQTQQKQQHQHEDVSYLDMSGGGRASSKKSSSWYDNWNNEAKSDKTFRCSAPLGGAGKTHSQANSDDDEDDNDNDCGRNEDDNGSQNYDICQVSRHDRDEMQKAITPELEHLQINDCPYMDLPAGHLSIEGATKYGQLQRIEKRALFFDQSKKYYCGVLNDWLLCYADGPTAAHPTITLYLKHSGIEIEHYGEGKRREVCFQITTADPNKKFLFQAISEVDAKEWIIAVEAAIRGDTATLTNNMTIVRKLPTPPFAKKITFIGHMTPAHDCIYEEPSPIFQSEKSAANKPPKLPQKQETFTALDCFEYDVPKGPPQSIKSADCGHTETETAELLNLSDNSVLGTEKIEFQSIVKDVHSKLSSQLSAGVTPERLKRSVKKTYSGGSSSTSDVDAVALTPSSVKEQKKQRKSVLSSTPAVSPQKTSANGITTSPSSNGNSACANERTAVKSWFFNRLNKTTSSGRSSSSTNSTNTSPAKCKQSEKENLLQSLELHDSADGSVGGGGSGGTDVPHSNSSNPASPILKNMSSLCHSSAGIDSSLKSKVDLIIKEFETSAHMGMLTMETLAGSAVASLSSFCDNDCNNYEPIMTVTTPPSSFLKKI
ncbi:uncharacterized protein blow isoform X2 [Eurosta solidaginis]